MSSIISIGLRSYLTDNTVLSIVKYSHLNAGFNAKCLLLYTLQLYQMRYSGRSGFAMRKATGARDIMFLQVTVDFNNCQSE